MKDDTISRKAAIDALANMHCKSDEDGYVWIIRSDAWARIDALPSVQPEKRTEERTKTHSCDLINRQAAIDAIRKDMYADKDYMSAIICEGIENVLNNLPSAQPEPRWTPCSEGLPKEYVDVLVWFEYYRFGEYNRMYSTYGIGNYDEEYDKWWINHESGWRDLHVFAWMPLPEPYEKDGEKE